MLVPVCKLQNPCPLTVLSVTWLGCRMCYRAVPSGQMPPFYHVTLGVYIRIVIFLLDKPEPFLLPCPVVSGGQLYREL